MRGSTLDDLHNKWLKRPVHRKAHQKMVAKDLEKLTESHLRLDAFVVEWFRQQYGRGYKPHIASVLKAFVAAQSKRGNHPYPCRRRVR